MQFLKEKWSYIANHFAKKVEENKDRKVTRHEIYLEEVYKILSWEDNCRTLGVFLLLNFIFWLIVLLGLRPLGIFFSFMLIFFLWDSYFETRNYSGYSLKYREAMDEMYNCLHEFRSSLLLLKKESPSSFTVGACIFFLMVSVLAKNISGYLFLYLCLLQIFFVPLMLQILPQEYSSALKTGLKSFCNIKGVLAEEELIPFIANRDFLNDDADLDSLLTDKTADSATNSLASGISGMPSYMEVADSQDVIEEDDLIPKRAGTQESAYIPGELSSDSDSEHHDLAFESTHFNGNSSSEEEKLLSKGLNFTDVTDKVGTIASTSQGHIGGMLTNLATMSTTLLSAAIQSAVKSSPVEKDNSSSESEFEMVSSDDVKE